MQSTLAYIGLAAIIAGGILGMFPLWKSATLSPDSIERRVYWTGCAIGSVLLFFSQFPDWRQGLFFSIGAAVALLAIAFQWTNHIKINGRIYSAFNNNRRPDRPPALDE
ncbi:hypothetical protein ORI20_32375 [Mycobacterium sp. CVI_P3]|uniref:Uncharacterized protein n=1 Tax=Mycobacterium pinniadriaticum TaxID=2994102 RepID=A0ABT3SQA6_9MYCO|nr:hypothetical protein [Mycobacterium pinniadriaticum]MCX2934959.1 hypothetical protein [Mycobacterium pinniadriaticum]MCX2941383.1 hypothetical protein [Mycobacterium pinniadriaticum]